MARMTKAQALEALRTAYAHLEGFERKDKWSLIDSIVDARHSLRLVIREFAVPEKRGHPRTRQDLVQVPLTGLEEVLPDGE